MDTNPPTGVVTGPEVIERGVLEIVSALVKELRGSTSPVPVALGSSLERDLGISSLERVELLLRLERRFGVRLPEETVAGAETSAELVAALSRAAPGSREPVPHLRPAVGAATGAPVGAHTLLEALQWHVQATPDRAHIFLQEDGGERPITYRALWDGARDVAAALAERGVAPGDTVALMLRTEEAFFRTFAGVLMAGAVPVPMYPPVRADRIAEYAHRQAAILRNAGSRLLVTFADADRVGSILRGVVEPLREVIDVDRLAPNRPGGTAIHAGPDSPALIQYTSGSTGDPKGVLLTHGNLLANIRAIGQAMDVRPDDVVASWLPLYHDMGLIGAWLGALYFGLPVVILSPLTFLSRPSRWLWAIHAHRATISPAPNFAFDLCVSKVADEEIEGLDLSSWRLALNGSEAVSADTIARFTRRFAPYGFRPDAMYPVYGLAEASVGLTMPPLSRPPRIDAIAREPYQRAREIRPADAGDPQPLRFVSCGKPLPGHELRVVDEEAQALGQRTLGRIQFRGPSVTTGYFRNPAATRAAFAGDWLDSGDFGYWADGELFVTGRAKDLIIRGGRNITPHEAEEIAGAVDGVRKGCVAAFGVHDAAVGTERFVLVAETRLTDESRREELRAEVAARVTDALGVPPDHVVIVSPGTVLKTPSGKIRRTATREAYETGRLLAGRRSVAAQWASLLGEGLQARLTRALGLASRVVFTSYIVILLATTLPFWALVYVVPRGRAVARLMKRWSRLMLMLTGLSPRVSGLEHLRSAGPAMIVANHASYIDVIVLMAVLPGDVRFIAKGALADIPVVGAVIRRAGHITIEKAEFSQRLAGADEITQALGRGISIAVFPEGTFFRSAGLLPFRLGAFRAAVEAGRSVVPVALRGTRAVLPDGTWLLRRSPIAVVIGAPLAPVASGWPEFVRLRDLARAEIARCAGETAIESGPG
ncbi:MAG TPA: AMP-binding protein [Vicinamibacterales bacterium]|nr:AMP-binding protein [Vicinamibacterales bacterium]